MNGNASKLRNQIQCGVLLYSSIYFYKQYFKNDITENGGVGNSIHSSPKVTNKMKGNL